LWIAIPGNIGKKQFYVFELLPVLQRLPKGLLVRPKTIVFQHKSVGVSEDAEFYAELKSPQNIYKIFYIKK